MRIKSNYLGNCVLPVLLGVCGCVSNPPPRSVIVVEPQTAPRVEVRQAYNYTQTSETSKTLISPEMASKFISDFNALYVSRGMQPPTFAVRVNPTAEGARTTPSGFQDQQATADLMRYFGQPLREGGIRLVDEASAPGAKVDVVLNLLVGWKSIQILGTSGETINKSVPDVQATAIRLADGAVLGQAGTANLIGQRQDAWVAVERVGVPDVMRSLALVLLEDMVVRKVQ